MGGRKSEAFLRTYSYFYTSPSDHFYASPFVKVRLSLFALVHFSSLSRVRLSHFARPNRINVRLYRYGARANIMSVDTNLETPFEPPKI